MLFAGGCAAARDGGNERRIEGLVASMTLEQKIGQMTMAEIGHITPQQAAAFHVGAVLNGGGGRPYGRDDATLADWQRLAGEFDAATRAAGVPLLWGTDAVHGHNNVRGATLFPHNIGLGATRDPALVRAIGLATARALRASGLAWTFAPTLAVARNLRWGRTYESYSEDPRLVALLGAAQVRGLQDGGALATAKHFIGDGATEGGVDQGDVRLGEADLLATHGAGHRAALRAGVPAVMASFNSWRGRKLHGHGHLLGTVLKRRLRFEGLVVTDWDGIGQVPGCTATRCAAALNAGIDMVMLSERWQGFIEDTLDLVRRGEVPEARVDDAVRRILRVKLRAGLLDRPLARPDDPALADRALARRAVRESLVLLKNERGLLPLARGTRVLVVGKGADSVALQAGGWSLSWQGGQHANADFAPAETVLQGIRAALGAAKVAFSETGEGVDAADFDAVIAVIGERPYAEGKGDIPPGATLRHADRHPEDLAVLQRVAGQGRPVVTVFLSGRPLEVNELLALSDAFVAAWLPGSEGGGVADMLFRRADGRMAHRFRGRLPFAWPRSADAADYASRRAQPLYRFGHGLAGGR